MGQSPEYFKIFGKNTLFNEHPVPYMLIDRVQSSVCLIVSHDQMQHKITPIFQYSRVLLLKQYKQKVLQLFFCSIAPLLTIIS